MKKQFQTRAKPPREEGVLILPRHIVKTSQIEVYGNWQDKNKALFCLKSGSHILAEIHPLLGLEMYLAALERGGVIDHRTFSASKSGYENGGGKGVIIIPDVKNTILAIRADEIEFVKDIASSRESEKIALTTKAGHGFTALCGFDKFAAAYAKAMDGEHVAIWPKNWPFDKPPINAPKPKSTPRGIYKFT